MGILKAQLLTSVLRTSRLSVMRLQTGFSWKSMMSGSGRLRKHGLGWNQEPQTD